MMCNTIYGFIIGQIIYNLSSPFKVVSNVMLKNNLDETNKQDQFVKWQSYGRLGYSIITLAVSLLAGILFNVNAYIPMILSLFCSLIGLLLSFTYSDSSIKEETNDSMQIKSLLKNKIMILILLANLIAVGTYLFLQGKATLLIQFVCQEGNIDIAKISLIVSAIVFTTRLFRVIFNLIFPTIYNRVNNKSNVVLAISILILISNIVFALGGNIDSSYILKLVLITLGFYIILSVRDMYAVKENKIIVSNIEEKEQKEAFVLANIYGKLGQLLSNAFALVILGFLSLNILYICILSFSIIQIFIYIPLSKYLKS